MNQLKISVKESQRLLKDLSSVTHKRTPEAQAPQSRESGRESEISTTEKKNVQAFESRMTE